MSLEDKEKAYLEEKIATLEEKIEEMRVAFSDADRVRQLRAWAIDRAIELLKGKSTAVSDVTAAANALVEYTHDTPEQKIAEAA